MLCYVVGQIKVEKQADQMIGEKQSDEAQILLWYVLGQMKCENNLARWWVKNSKIKYVIGEMKAETQSGQMIGEKQPDQTKYCYAMSLVKWKLKNSLVRW